MLLLFACPLWPTLIRSLEVPCASENGAKRFHHDRRYMVNSARAYAALAEDSELPPAASGPVRALRGFGGFCNVSTLSLMQGRLCLKMVSSLAPRVC